MSEVGGPVEDLIAKGPISKYAQGMPAVSGGPIPEMLKNYMDVSSCGALPGTGTALTPCCGWSQLALGKSCSEQPVGRTAFGGGASQATPPRRESTHFLCGLHSPRLSYPAWGTG